MSLRTYRTLNTPNEYQQAQDTRYEIDLEHAMHACYPDESTGDRWRARDRWSRLAKKLAAPLTVNVWQTRLLLRGPQWTQQRADAFCTQLFDAIESEDRDALRRGATSAQRAALTRQINDRHQWIARNQRALENDALTESQRAAHERTIADDRKTIARLRAQREHLFRARV